MELSNLLPVWILGFPFLLGVVELIRTLKGAG